MAARQERRSFWTWGYESDEPSNQERLDAAKRLAGRLGREVVPPPIPAIADIPLRAPRVSIPERLKSWVATDHTDRVTHTYGGHPVELLDLLRPGARTNGLRGD